MEEGVLLKMSSPKGGSPLSDWKLRHFKIRSLNIPVSIVAQDHTFLFHSRDWKKKQLQLAWIFFRSATKDDVKVNKTQIISAKIDRFRTTLSVSLLFQISCNP